MKIIKYNYEGTGIKTLRTTSSFVLLTGIIGGISCIVFAFNYDIYIF